MGRKTDGYQVQVNGFGRAVLPAWSVQICEVSHCKNIIKTQLQGNILILMWDNISFGQPNWQRRCKMAGLWTANFTPQFAAISKISLENLSLKKVFCKCRRFLHRFMLNMRLLVVWKTYCKLSTHHHLISFHSLKTNERKMDGLDVWTLKPWPFFHALERGLGCL